MEGAVHLALLYTDQQVLLPRYSLDVVWGCLPQVLSNVAPLVCHRLLSKESLILFRKTYMDILTIDCLGKCSPVILLPHLLPVFHLT